MNNENPEVSPLGSVERTAPWIARMKHCAKAFEESMKVGEKPNAVTVLERDTHGSNPATTSTTTSSTAKEPPAAGNVKGDE